MQTLLDRGETVAAVTRDAEKADSFRARGARIAVADVHDVDALRRVFRTGRRAFLLNPPADIAGDTDAEESRTAAAIVAALDGSELEMVVAESTYGAQPGDRCGDLSVLHDFEQALARQPIPTSVIRAAYYMSNWDTALTTARDEGVLHSLFPGDFVLPMVAPADLGRVAADLLTGPGGGSRIHHVEGPARYTGRDVAAAFATALDRPVRIEVTPREGWNDAYAALGFSAAAAASYARMTAVTLEDGPAAPDDPIRGNVTLDHYIAALVAGDRGRPAKS